MMRLLWLAIDAECKRQTPPFGGRGAMYACPACGAERETRGAFREHLTQCTEFRKRQNGALVTALMTGRPTQVS